MLPNYHSRFLPWVTLARWGTFLHHRKALNTQPWCQVHRGLPTFFDFEVLSMLCAVGKCVMKMLPTTPTDSPSRGACVHQICAAHKHVLPSFTSLICAGCAKGTTSRFTGPRLDVSVKQRGCFSWCQHSGVKWECAEWQVEDFWCFCCVCVFFC